MGCILGCILLTTETEPAACHSSSSISIKQDHLAMPNSSRSLLQPTNSPNPHKPRKPYNPESPLGCRSTLLWLHFQTSLFKSWKNTFICVPSHNFQSPRNVMRWPAWATRNWHVWANLPQKPPQHLDPHIPKQGPQSSAEGFWPVKELNCCFGIFYLATELRKTDKAGQKSR